MIHPLLMLAFSSLSLAQFKAPQLPLNPYSIAEDYQRLYNLRILNGRSDDAGAREADDCDRYEVRLWAALGISLKQDAAIGGERSFCVAEPQQVEWDGDASQDVLLVLGGRVFQQFRYVLFLNVQGSLRYAGYIDAFTKYSDPAPRIVHFGGQSFLQTVSTMDRSGTGQSEVTWSDLTPAGGHAVFSYPDQGIAGSAELNREWNGSVLEIDPPAGIVTIGLSVSYSIPSQSRDDIEIPLFTVKHQAVYRWSPDVSKFDLDPGRSTLAAAELDQVFGSDGHDVPLSGFLDWYFSDLTRIALEGNARQKQWLQSWLEREPASTHRQDLLDRLKN